MPTFRHVLVATDFAPASAHTLRIAADYSSCLGARLCVVHVIVPPPFPYPASLSDQARETGRVRLEDTVALLGPRVHGILREGFAAAEIVAVASEIGADLVVIGSRGRRGIPRALLGSVAEKVVRLCPAPVLTVPPWRFEDRVEAGRELATWVSHLREASPAVIATSLGGVVVAAEVARIFGDTPALLLATPVHHDHVLLGALCEDGTTRMESTPLALSIAAPERDRAVLSAKALLSAEATELRGSPWIADVWRREVVVVCDVLDEPSTALVVCDVLRRQGATRLVVAAPAASKLARAALESVVDELIFVHLADDASVSSIYHDEQPVTLYEAARCLRVRVGTG